MLSTHNHILLLLLALTFLLLRLTVAYMSCWVGSRRYVCMVVSYSTRISSSLVLASFYYRQLNSYPYLSVCLSVCLSLALIRKLSDWTYQSVYKTWIEMIVVVSLRPSCILFISKLPDFVSGIKIWVLKRTGHWTLFLLPLKLNFLKMGFNLSHFAWELINFWAFLYCKALRFALVKDLGKYPLWKPLHFRSRLSGLAAAATAAAAAPTLSTSTYAYGWSSF